MKTLPAVDVVIVGGGWTGLLMAKELGSRTALSIVVLERGGPRKVSDYVSDMDELDYAVHHRMMQDFSKEAFTIRHSTSDRAYPLRQLGNFLPGTGVGGAGEHWSGLCKRFVPNCFEALSKTIERYGAKKLPEDHSIQDWGITYDDLEPYYAHAEQLLGTLARQGTFAERRSKVVTSSRVPAARIFRHLQPRFPIFRLCSGMLRSLSDIILTSTLQLRSAGSTRTRTE
jgi:gluconate 2-dehydrogenase alpha chain